MNPKREALLDKMWIEYKDHMEKVGFVKYPELSLSIFPEISKDISEEINNVMSSLPSGPVDPDNIPDISEAGAHLISLISFFILGNYYIIELVSFLQMSQGILKGKDMPNA